MTSVPYVFVNGTTADGTQVNADFTTVCTAIDTNNATLTAAIAALPPPGPTRVVYIQKGASPYSLVVAATETRCRARMWGGGGGGGGIAAGGSSTPSAVGGGGGGFVDVYITGLTPGTITITIGGGGSAGTTGNGGDGAATQFGTAGSYASANGGKGSGTGTGGTAAITIGTGLALPGQAGQGGIFVVEPGPLTDYRIGGPGGGSLFVARPR